MDGFQVSALCIAGTFWLLFFGKLLLQDHKGIRTWQMGNNNKDKSLRITELGGVCSHLLMVLVQLVSILFNCSLLPCPVRILGVCVAVEGTVLFLVAMLTMRTNWRVGVAPQDSTSLVQYGIYRFSRNPAFLGLDIYNCGLMLAFCNMIMVPAVCLNIFMLHRQILQEEKMLSVKFGTAYQTYYNKVHRYIGRKRSA